MADLAGLLRPLVLQATIVKPTALKKGADAPPTATKFGGLPYAEQGETWPRCGGCGEGLSFIFQCNLTECPHERGRASLFTFFYCRECCAWGDLPDDLRDAWVVRRYSSPALAKAVAMKDASAPKQRVTPCMVTLAQAPTLPDAFEIGEVSPKTLEIAKQINPQHWSTPYEEAVGAIMDPGNGVPGDGPGAAGGGGADGVRTQIGGYAGWVQGPAFPDCQACGGRMRLLAQIDSETAPGLVWGDAGRVYLFECPSHPDPVKMTLQCS